MSSDLPDSDVLLHKPIYFLETKIPGCDTGGFTLQAVLLPLPMSAALKMSGSNDSMILKYW